MFAYIFLSKIRTVCNLGGVYDESKATSKKKAAPVFENGQLLTDRQKWLRENKPPLLILDEIDGISKSSAGSGANKTIQAITKLLDQDLKESDCAKWVVRSPIIAICNDIEARSLTELKRYAQVVYLEGTASGKLKSRLKEICRLEHIGAQDGALIDLVNATNADVRACLNALQLLSATSSFIDTKTVRDYLSKGSIKEEKTQIADLYRLCLMPEQMLAKGGGHHQQNLDGGLNKPHKNPALARKTQRVLQLTSDFEFRAVAREFLRHTYGVSMRGRSVKTCSALKRFSFGEELDRMGFVKREFGLRGAYGLPTPILFVSAHCAPPNRGAGAARALQLVNRRHNDRGTYQREQKKTMEWVHSLLLNSMFKTEQKFGVNTLLSPGTAGHYMEHLAAKTEAITRLQTAAAVAKRSSLRAVARKDVAKEKAGRGRAAASTKNAPKSEGAEKKAKRAVKKPEQKKGPRDAVTNEEDQAALPNSVDDDLKPFLGLEFYKKQRAVQYFRNVLTSGNAGARDFSFLALACNPTKNSTWHLKDRSADSRFVTLRKNGDAVFLSPKTKEEVEILNTLKPLQTAVQLQSDFMLLWRTEDYSDQLTLAPAVSQLAYPYNDVFSENLNWMHDDFQKVRIKF